MPREDVRSPRFDPFARPGSEEDAGGAAEPGAGNERRHHRRYRRPRIPETGWTSLADIWNPVFTPPEPVLVAPSPAGAAVERPASRPVQDRPATMVGAPGERGGTTADLSNLARGGLLNLVGALANGGFAFLFALLLTHGLKAARAGVFFEAIALFSIVANTAQLGGDDGLVRFIPRFRVERRIRDLRTTVLVGLWPIAAVGAVFAAVVFVFAPQLAQLLVHARAANEAAFESSLASYIRILAPFIPIAAAETAVFSATRGFGTMTPSVLLDNMGRSAARLPLAAVVLVGSLGAASLAMAWALPILGALALGLVWLLSLLRRAERWGRERSKDGTQAIQPPTGPRRVASEFWRFSAPRGLAAIFGITVYWLDTLLLGALRDPADAAVYTAASRYLFLGFFALGAIQLVIGPMISGLISEGNRERARIVYQTATQWLVLASWPVYLTLAVFAPFLLRVFRPEFDRGQDAMLILAVAMLISIASGPVMVVLLMSGKSWWTLANSAVAVTLNVVLNLMLIPRFGMEGAAVAWLASIVFNNLAGVLEVRFLLKLTPFGPGLLTVAFASTACFGGLGLLTRHFLGMSLPWFVLFGLVASGLYLALLYSFRGRLHLSVFMEAVRLRNRRQAARGQRLGAMA